MKKICNKILSDSVSGALLLQMAEDSKLEELGLEALIAGKCKKRVSVRVDTIRYDAHFSTHNPFKPSLSMPSYLKRRKKKNYKKKPAIHPPLQTICIPCSS